MPHNQGMAMLATFYGGPADGGVLTLAEPIRTHLRFPMTPAEALETLEIRDGGGTLVPNNVPAEYELEMSGPGRPYRDPGGRVRYLYIIPRPTLTEGQTDA